jgi:hypothetical protein
VLGSAKESKRAKAMRKIEAACCELLSVAAVPRVHRAIEGGTPTVRAKILLQETRVLCEASTLLRAALAEASTRAAL